VSTYCAGGERAALVGNCQYTKILLTTRVLPRKVRGRRLGRGATRVVGVTAQINSLSCLKPYNKERNGENLVYLGTCPSERSCSDVYSGKLYNKEEKYWALALSMPRSQPGKQEESRVLAGGAVRHEGGVSPK